MKNYCINESGVTLLETLVYIALFSVIIGGTLVAVFQIVESTSKSQARVLALSEGTFIISKIKWLSSGAESIVIQDPASVVVTKAGIAYTLTVSGGVFTFATAEASLPLSSSYVVVTGPPGGQVFSYSPSEKEFSAAFLVQEEVFNFTAYVY